MTYENIETLKNIIGDRILMFHTETVIYSGLHDCLCFDPKYPVVFENMNTFNSEIRYSLKVKFRIPIDSERNDVFYFGIEKEAVNLKIVKNKLSFKYYMSEIFIVESVKVLIVQIKNRNGYKRTEIKEILIKSTNDSKILLSPDSVCEDFEPVKVVLNDVNIEAILKNYDNLKFEEPKSVSIDEYYFEYETVEFK